jgi:hypothetical protein
MTGAPLRVQHCHCSRCRKARGTAHATNLFVAIDGIRFVRGEDLVTLYRVPGARTVGHAFCRVCGASMPRLDASRSLALVPMGSFDDDPGARPERHVFVASKAVWHEITDDLPTFDAAPPSL